MGGGRKLGVDSDPGVLHAYIHQKEGGKWRLTQIQNIFFILMNYNRENQKRRSETIMELYHLQFEVRKNTYLIFFIWKQDIMNSDFFFNFLCSWYT